MARPLRLEFPGAVYHVTSRGNHRQDIYPDDDHRTAFLAILTTSVRRFRMICHAYCLMDNHYHLLIETPDGNLSKGMRQINAVYTQYFNRKEKKSGHLFQGRYKSVLIEKDSHLLEAIRYVLLNPVRAGIVKSPAEYQWSSYRGTCGMETPHRCLESDWMLGMFGTGRRAVAKFSEFVAEGGNAESPWRRVRGQVLLGSDTFCEALEPVLKGHADLKEIPATQRLATRPSLESMFSGVDRSTRNGKMREAVDRWGYAQKEIADFLHLHYSTVSRLMKEKGVVAIEKEETAPLPSKRVPRTPKAKKPAEPETLPQLSLF